jgi:DNA invertase Pin-like site-specific DNA recombinase
MKRLEDMVAKAAIYARVSTDDGRQTVANQLQQLYELAEARRLYLVKEYCDEETGSTGNRPAFLEMLRDARLRRFRVLLITDVSRNGNLCTFAENRCNAFNSLAGHWVVG